MVFFIVAPHVRLTIFIMRVALAVLNSSEISTVELFADDLRPPQTGIKDFTASR